MKRSSELKRSGRVNPRNDERASAALDENFGEEAITVRRMPCLVSGCNVWPVQPAHVKSVGAGGGRFDIVPLCHVHHREQHGRGIKTFSAKYTLDLRAEADRIAAMHSEPLGLRAVALRWAERSEGRVLPAMLDSYERDALHGWVRRRMERESTSRRNYLLVRIAGLPDNYDRDNYDPAAVERVAFDREALAHAVMLELGEPFTSDPHGEHGIAWTLCELAGWPS